MTERKSKSLHLVLVGGGHSNVLLIKNIFENDSYCLHCNNVQVTLISNYKSSYYSGMLPGCVAELYQPEEIQIDLEPLCRYYGVTFILGTVTSIDKERKSVHCRDRSSDITYDILSLDVGSTVRGEDIPGFQNDNVISTRPISELLSKIQYFEKSHARSFENEQLRIVVVGAGLAGVELALAFKARFERKFSSSKISTTIINNKGTLLEEHGSWVASKVESVLREKDVIIESCYRAVEISRDGIQLSNGNTQKTINADLVVWATGAAPVPLLNNIDVLKDGAGFIRVSDTLQSVSSPFIFATGDCSSIDGYPYVTKAGVYAVREAPILTENILSLIKHLQKGDQNNLRNYVPQRGFLALLSTGDAEGITSWKGIGVRGGWVWKLKDKIDRDFMNLFDVKKHLGVHQSNTHHNVN